LNEAFNALALISLTLALLMGGEVELMAVYTAEALSMLDLFVFIMVSLLFR
jgi:hypothetical protein